MQKLYSPENEAELAVIRSILEGEGINYFVHNDYFGSLNVGAKVYLYNAKTIMVSEGEYQRSKEIIDDFLKAIKGTSKASQRGYSIWDKIRMIFEIVFMGWLVPGKKWKKGKKHIQ